MMAQGQWGNLEDYGLIGRMDPERTDSMTELNRS